MDRFSPIARKGPPVLCLLAVLIALPTAASAQGLYAPDLQAALQRASFDDWAARYEEAAATVDGFAVESVEEFIKIEEYYAKFANDGVTVHAFRLPGGELIRCIDVRTQASVRAADLDPDNLPTTPVSAPASFAAAGGESPDAHQADFGLDGSPDENGDVRQCPAGSFPKFIRPIESYYHFRRFADIFKKLPGDATPISPGAPPGGGTKETHQYTVVFGDYANTGQIADFNLWAPYVEVDWWFSLTQLWIAGGEGGNLQTAEAGWQVYPYLYGNDGPNLFIYYTPDGYFTGCYNLDCPGFVQTDASVVIGGPFAQVSEPGGDQYQATIGFVRDGNGGNHWWLKVGSKWVGYYPTTIYDSQGIKDQADLVNLGGELIDNDSGGHVDSEMGSGRYPSAGYSYASYVRKIQYVTLGGATQDATDLFGYASVPNCWDIGNVEYSGQSDWRTNFYYGGACNAPDDDDNDDNDDNDNDDNDDNDNDDDNDDDDAADDDAADDDAADGDNGDDDNGDDDSGGVGCGC